MTYADAVKWLKEVGGDWYPEDAPGGGRMIVATLDGVEGRVHCLSDETPDKKLAVAAAVSALRHKLGR